MAYTPTDWKDHILSDTYYNITENSDGSCEITPHGSVITQGTPMNAENFNHMETGIADAHTAVSQLESGKVDKVTGKGLSTNDYTTTEKTKLAGLSNYDDTTVNNSMVRASDADSNEQSQLFKTVDGTSTNIDPKCSFATKANRVNINTASTSANVELPLLAPGTQLTDAVYKIDEITYNPSKDQLTTPNFSGALNTVAINQGASTGWRKIAEFDNQDSANITQALTILVLDGDNKGSTGTGIITIKTHSENDGTVPTNLSASLQIDYMSGVGTLFNTDNYKLTYTIDGLTVTYKFWVKISVAYQGDIFQLLNAASPSQQKSIINRVTFVRGTFSSGATGYMTDGDVTATGVIDCEMGTIGNDIAGNAATATKLSGTQTVLYESTTNTNSFTLSGLFTDWSAVMIYLTGEWVSGTSGTHGFFVPLKHLKDRGAGGIADFCGVKVINFLYVDDDSMRWFERQSQGAMTYSAVKVVGLY